MYLLLPGYMPAFVFRTRSWGKFHHSFYPALFFPQSHQLTRNLVEHLYVLNFVDRQYNEDMIHHLVMDEKRLQMLKALSKSFPRIDDAGNSMDNNQQWAADFVKGKGAGLIFSLHGKPGVGKTCTAGSLLGTPLHLLGGFQLTRRA